MDQIHLREISQCSPEEICAVRDVRNIESIRRMMYTDHEISLEEHLGWVERVKDDKRQIVFVVLLNQKVSGVVSLSAIDRLHRKADWAFYLHPDTKSGVGAIIELSLLRFSFEELGLEKLNCEVLETNPSVVKLHKKFGFEVEGFRRSNILKNQQRIGVHLMGLTRDDWLNRHAIIIKSYQSFFERFQVVVEMPTNDQPI